MFFKSKQIKRLENEIRQIRSDLYALGEICKQDSIIYGKPVSEYNYQNIASYQRDRYPEIKLNQAISSILDYFNLEIEEISAKPIKYIAKRIEGRKIKNDIHNQK